MHCSLINKQLKQLAMKTKNFVLTALALFVAATVSATKIPTLNVIPVEKQRALVAFEAPKAAEVEISLKNKEGEVLYYKKSEAPVENLRMILDFQNLNDGVYDVSLKYHNSKINRKVTISNHLVKGVGKEKREYEPYCSLEEGLLKVSYLNCDQKNVHMNIYRNGQHLAGRKLGKEMCIQKAFDFSKLESGQYNIVLSSCNDDYLFTVNK